MGILSVDSLNHLLKGCPGVGLTLEKKVDVPTARAPPKCVDGCMLRAPAELCLPDGLLGRGSRMPGDPLEREIGLFVKLMRKTSPLFL